MVVLADEHLTGPDKEKVQERLNAWITELIAERLKPPIEIANARTSWASPVASPSG